VVKLRASVQQSPLAPGEEAPTRARRGQVLIVEPDPLTQWSLKMYLGRWFSVDSTSSIASARRILETRPVEALIVSDELPPTALVSLEQRAHSFNARVTIVRIVTDSSKMSHAGPHLGCLEKPFELAQLARLLGIPESELPRE
jgi:DNA-binding NtrC family response regulator